MTSVFKARGRRCSLLSAKPTAFDLGLLSPISVGHDEVVSDSAFASAMIEVEIALARAAARTGIIAEASAESISHALVDLRLDVSDLAQAAVPSGNPVLPLVALLRARVSAVNPNAAAELHRGATSQDIIDTTMMLVATRALSRIDTSLAAVVGSLADLAERHRTTLMAARTLTQHSTPTTFGLVVAGWLLAVDGARRALRRPLPAQLGGASGTLASFVQLGGLAAASAMPAAFAAELNLSAPLLPWHTRRAPITGLGDALVSVDDALGAIASSVATLARTEIGELSESAGTGRGGSSAMPQKRNPVLSVLIRSAAQRAPGLGSELHRSAALTVDQRADGAWHAEWPVLRELLRLTLGASANAADLLGDLQVDSTRMRTNLDFTGPLIVSERLALALGPILGVPAVQELVDHAIAGGPLRSTLEAALADVEGGDRIDLDELLDSANYIGDAFGLIDAALAAADPR